MPFKDAKLNEIAIMTLVTGKKKGGGGGFKWCWKKSVGYHRMLSWVLSKE